MAIQARWRVWLRSSMMTAALGGALAGCNKSNDSPAVVESAPKTPTLSIGQGSDPTAAVPAPAAVAPAAEVKADKYHLPFNEACTVEISADSGVALPPTLTATRKNTGQLNEEVQRIWNSIRFTTTEGKKQTYILELDVVQAERELGRIEILMQPDTAPNHSRNFIALAMVKYYDGLQIDRIVRQQGEGEAAGNKLVLLEAGSPVESIDPATSHLGYWLRPEFSDTAKHEEGTVGACLLASEDNAETAAVRFYINLTPAPAMDGNFTPFGKVIKGLEIAKQLAEQPVREKEGGPEQGRPVTPIVIRSATVRTIPVVE